MAARTLATLGDLTHMEIILSLSCFPRCLGKYSTYYIEIYGATLLQLLVVLKKNNGQCTMSL